MPGKYNPYRPDKIAPPGIFSGRIDELRLIDHCLLQTKEGNPQHFLLEGGAGNREIFRIPLRISRGDRSARDHVKCALEFHCGKYKPQR